MCEPGTHGLTSSAGREAGGVFLVPTPRARIAGVDQAWAFYVGAVDPKELWSYSFMKSTLAG